MTESLIEFLLNELSQVLKEEINLQRGMKEEIKLIKDELESIRAFLRVADAEEEKDPQLAVFVDHTGHQKRRPHFKCLKKIASSYKKWKVNHQTGSKLQSIKTRVEDISNRRQRYPSLLERDSSSRMANMEAINEFRRNALLEDESQLVGTEEPRQ
ncbi:hypothetical protein L6164_001540 [Bauhinia variegata]|uniref:Uncharacterized protein n=1 Tax=Bauhinia variegata TaxID=167791 RepID=A0ACB9QC59_BAUVA|nr:hypothetical protein L6164_001540 [Bauhinia variegata]